MIIRVPRYIVRDVHSDTAERRSTARLGPRRRERRQAWPGTPARTPLAAVRFGPLWPPSTVPPPTVPLGRAGIVRRLPRTPQQTHRRDRRVPHARTLPRRRTVSRRVVVALENPRSPARNTIYLPVAPPINRFPRRAGPAHHLFYARRADDSDRRQTPYARARNTTCSSVDPADRILSFSQPVENAQRSRVAATPVTWYPCCVCPSVFGAHSIFRPSILPVVFVVSS